MDLNYHLLEYPWVITPWKLIGYSGTLLFASRWLIQLYYSRKAGKPVQPRSFWIISVLGSAISLTYFTLSPKADSVGVMANLFPFFMCSYMLWLDINASKREAARDIESRAEKTRPASVISEQPAIANE